MTNDLFLHNNSHKVPLSGCMCECNDNNHKENTFRRNRNAIPCHVTSVPMMYDYDFGVDEWRGKFENTTISFWFRMIPFGTKAPLSIHINWQPWTPWRALMAVDGKQWKSVCRRNRKGGKGIEQMDIGWWLYRLNGFFPQMLSSMRIHEHKNVYFFRHFFLLNATSFEIFCMSLRELPLPPAKFSPFLTPMHFNPFLSICEFRSFLIIAIAGQAIFIIHHDFLPLRFSGEAASSSDVSVTVLWIKTQS